MRAKSGIVHLKRRKKVLKKAKGFRGSRSKLIRIATPAVLKAGQHAYSSRRQFKSQMRSLWIMRINAAARLNGLTYSVLIHKLNKANTLIDRKALADLAYHEPEQFALLVKKIS